MANPFYNNIPNSSTQPNNLNDIYKMLVTSKNPVQLFNNIAKSNPNMAPVLDMLNQGVSPEKIFNIICQKRGINPQDFINRMVQK